MTFYLIAFASLKTIIFVNNIDIIKKLEIY